MTLEEPGMGPFTTAVISPHGPVALDEFVDVIFEVSDASPSGPSVAAVEDVNRVIEINTLLPPIPNPVLTGFSQPSHGTVFDNGDGTLTYSPEPDFFGIDTFDYSVSDSAGATETFTLSVVVAEVNDPPIVLVEFPTISVIANSAAHLKVLNNVFDVDGDYIGIFFADSPDNGRLTSNVLREYTYTPDDGFVGTDSFRIGFRDGRGGLIFRDIQIDVLPHDSELISIQWTADEVATTIENGTTYIEAEPGGTISLVNSISSAATVIVSGYQFSYELSDPAIQFERFEPNDQQFLATGNVFARRDFPLISAIAATSETDIYVGIQPL
jgi:hypothetical protein